MRLPMILLLWVVLGCLMSESPSFAADKNPQWNFSVEPGLNSDMTRVKARAMGGAQSILFCVTALHPEPGIVLKSQLFSACDHAEFLLPPVAQSTDVEVTARSDSSATLTLFQWNTLLPEPGASLMDYRGRDEFLPPEDFDAYWARAQAELTTLDPQPRVTRIPEKDTETGLLHRVELRAVGNTTIVCWYYVPREAFDTEGKAIKKYPTIAIMPGYGAEEPPIDRTASGFITLSINPRNHGPSKEFWTAPGDHLAWQIEDPEHYYYRYAFLDNLQAVRFLFLRPEVDADRIAAEGGSQGGLFAIALAALVPRIACVCTNVTAFSDYPDGMALARIGHHAQFRRMLAERGEAEAEAIRKSLAYTDGANLAGRVRCPIQINMAGQDPVCPFVCGIVIYHRIAKGVPREFNLVPDAKHEVPEAMREHNRRWYDLYLKPK